MKILVIRFSSIGDIVLTSPVIRCLRKKFPEAEIHYCTKKQYVDVVALNPNINKLHLLENSLNTLVNELKKEKYTHIIDLHNNLRTRIIKLQVKSKYSTYNKLNIKKWRAVNFKNISVLPFIHIVDRYFEAVKNLGVENDHLGLDFFNGETVLENFAPELSHTNYIAFAIGAQFATKQMPVEKIISLCKKINRPVVLLGGNNDVENGIKISSNCATVINLCGKLTLYQSAQVVKNAALVISHDTGMMHIAAAYNKKIISLWGNTIPEFGMYPYYGKTLLKEDLNAARNGTSDVLLISEVENLNCRPCSKIGYRQCPKKHFSCMNMHNEEKIIDFIEKVLLAR